MSCHLPTSNATHKVFGSDIKKLYDSRISKHDKNKLLLEKLEESYKVIDNLHESNDALKHKVDKYKKVNKKINEILSSE